MTNESFICLNCEAENRKAVVSLNQTGRCSVCNSDSVLSEAKLVSMALEQGLLKAAPLKKATATSVAQGDAVTKTTTVTPTASIQDKVNDKTEYYKQIRQSNSQPMRLFLQRNHFDDVNQWWDGWGSWVEASLGRDVGVDGNPSEGEYETVRLTLTNHNGDHRHLIFYINPEDEGMRDIGEVFKREVKR
jgi:hypothetical protein